MSQQHVMLSYEWTVQKLSLSIYDYLVEKGIVVWMDIKTGTTTDNLFETIGEAIENSSCFICFMTPEYQKSDFCKQELQYAKQCNIPIIPLKLEEDWTPTSWLGFITVGLVWLDFCHRKNVEKRAVQLYRRICKTIGSQSQLQKSESRENETEPHSYSFPESHMLSFSTQNKTTKNRKLQRINQQREDSLTDLSRQFSSHTLYQSRMKNIFLKEPVPSYDKTSCKFRISSSAFLEQSTPYTSNIFRNKSTKLAPNSSYGNDNGQRLLSREVPFPLIMRDKPANLQTMVLKKNGIGANSSINPSKGTDYHQTKTTILYLMTKSFVLYTPSAYLNKSSEEYFSFETVISELQEVER